MGNNVKVQSFSFNIEVPVEVSGKPQKKSIVNSFDLAADLVSLSRIDGETNASFKQRIMDVCVNPGGPTYQGFINNLTRAFGYTKSNAITISLKLSSAGSSIAPNPRVDILPNRVVLYSNWKPDGTETIDREIRTYKPDDEGYFLSDLVAEINLSTCFSAVLHSGVRPNLHSSCLVRTSSDNYIIKDPVESSNFTNLVGSNIVEGSLIFDETNIFRTEVYVTPTSAGQYFVDYDNGKIYPYSLPSGEYGVSYHYGIFPLVIDYSLIQLFSFQEDDFLDELFNLETLDSGEEQRALPNREGSEVLHQLFKETEVFWGK